ncbi:MAG: patatin-like phospholipase family protein [Burkholderiales bacterium]
MRLPILPTRHSRRSTTRLALVVMLAALLGACASRPINPPLAKADPESGYRWARRLALPDNDPGTLFVLAFSGGGTRAAAFSYGVLEELNRTPVIRTGATHTMLDEVDLVTGVSGGSFTALAFGLYGKALFEHYETQFLKRDVEGELIARLLNPATGLKTWSDGYGRSELAEQYYDEILFHGATYGDLIDKLTPTVLASSTLISTGNEWVFSQTNFDIICSDLSKMRLARAAAASSAVPIVMSPVTLENYAGSCGYETPRWLMLPKSDDAWPGTRLQQRAVALSRYLDRAKRPYMHLVDGGLADNLGLYAFVGDLQEMATSSDFREQVTKKGLRRIAIVVVNSRSADTLDYDRYERAPGSFELLMQSMSVPIDRFSNEAILALQDIIREWRLEWQLDLQTRRADGKPPTIDDVPNIEFSTINVSFDALADPAERAFLLALPTSFVLPDKSVDRLRAAAAQLLRESPSYQKLVHELSESAGAEAAH